MKKYKFLFAISVIAIGLMSVLLASINEKKEEKESLLSVPKIEKWETKNEEFRKFYPREFDSWKQTKNSDQIDDMLKLHPEMVVLWAGYAFSKDYNAPRGHFYAIDDVSNSLRTGAPTDNHYQVLVGHVNRLMFQELCMKKETMNISQGNGQNMVLI